MEALVAVALSVSVGLGRGGGLRTLLTMVPNSEACLSTINSVEVPYCYNYNLL